MKGVVIASIVLSFSSATAINFTKKKNTNDLILKSTKFFETPNKIAVDFQGNKISRTSVRVIDSVYSNFELGLTVVCNGLFEATGDNLPNIKVGLIKKNSVGKWDTIVKIGAVGVIQVGPEKYKWKNDTLKIKLPVEYYPTSTNQIVYSGVFKLIYYECNGSKRQIKSSNEFLIESLSFKNKSNKQLKGFLDTTFTRSYSESELEFHHSRVFTGTALGVYTVWHKLRIYAPNSINPFLFDKTFAYQIYPNAVVNEFFEAEDFNFDSNVDFRIKNNEGSFDYYLYHPELKSFVYSEVFSKAYSYSIDTEVNILTANFSRFVPLEGTYDLEAKFLLYPFPEIRIFSLKRRFLATTGTILQDIDTSQLSFLLKLQLHDLPQPELLNLSWISQVAACNKKHYFPSDSVFLLLNDIDYLNDISKLVFVLEVFNPKLKTWQLSSANKYLIEKNRLKIDYGSKIKVGNVNNISKLETSNNCVLNSGKYRVKIFKDSKPVAQTPDFYIYK